MIKLEREQIKEKLYKTLSSLDMTIKDITGGYESKNTDWVINEAFDLGLIDYGDYIIATKHFCDIGETIILDYDIKCRHFDCEDNLLYMIERLLEQSQNIADKLKITR